MAGWSAAYDAVFAKYGFIVSNDLDEALTIAAVLDQQSAAEGRSRRRGHRFRRRRHLGRRCRGAAAACRCRSSPSRIQSGDQGNGCRPMAAARNPDRRHRARRDLGRACRRASTLLDASDEVDAIAGRAVAVERGADAVQGGRAEAGARGAAQAGGVLFLHAAVGTSRAASLRNPAWWCCRDSPMSASRCGGWSDYADVQPARSLRTRRGRRRAISRRI